MSLRILILANRVPYPRTDGGALAMHAVIEGYRRAGCTVHLLAMDTSRHPADEPALRAEYSGLHGITLVPVDNRVRAAGVLRNYFFSRQPNHAERFRSEAFDTALERLLRSFRPQVVQAESVFLSPCVETVRAGSDALCVLRMHNVEHRIWEKLSRETAQPLRRHYFASLARRMQRFEEAWWTRYDLLLPITAADAAEAAPLAGPGRVFTLPFGIDTAAVAPDAGGVWEGYHLAAMDWLPNQEAVSWFVQSVWPVIERASPEFRFQFAGRHMPEALCGIQRGGLRCAGAEVDAEAFSRDKKILIVPLRSGGGIRVKILEGMARAKLVISTDAGIAGIEATAGEHFLRANTPKEFAQAVRWTLDHPAEAERIAARGRSLVEDSYDASVLAARLARRLEEAVRATGHAAV